MKRVLSLLITVLALFVVPLLAYVQGESVTRMQLQAQGWACGLPILGLYLQALLVSGCLSVVAFGARCARVSPATAAQA